MLSEGKGDEMTEENIRREVQDKLSVAISASRKRSQLEANIVVKQCEDFLVQMCVGFRMDELDAVMLSVDKWFTEGDPRLKNNPATRAADVREIALEAVEGTIALLRHAQKLLTQVTTSLRDEDGKCRECGWGQTGQYHHANCPVGRLFTEEVWKLVREVKK